MDDLKRMVFPAHAGMNPDPNPFNRIQDRVPRTRGDEPTADHLTGRLLRCSPHTRG